MIIMFLIPYPHPLVALHMLRKQETVFICVLLWVQDSSGASRSLSRAEFVNLAWSSVGHGSEEEYGLLFDSVVVTQEHGGLLLDLDAVKEEGRVDWGGLCSFLLLELSDKVKSTKSVGVPRWKPPRTLTCPHRDPVQKVKHHWPPRESGHVAMWNTRTHCSTLSGKRFDTDWTGESRALLSGRKSTLLNIVPGNVQKY